MRFVFLLTALAGCEEPLDLETCGLTDLVDCCTTDQQCLDGYGLDFPYCASPGESTGTCSQCVEDEQCGLDQVCRVLDPDEFYQACVPA